MSSRAVKTALAYNQGQTVESIHKLGLQAALRLPMVGIKVWLEIEKIILEGLKNEKP
jgi:hypothetical protein